MAHVVIKNNEQNKPKNVASSKGKIVSGKPHIAKHSVGSLNHNKPVNTKGSTYANN